jgi:hypothetical protein
MLKLFFLSYICIKNHFYSLFFFSLPPGGERNANAKVSPHVYLRLEAGFCKVAKNCQVICQTFVGVFSVFLPNIKDADPIWQTGVDAL